MIDELTLGVTPFRGSWAVRRGLVTKRVLRGPRYHRLFHDIYLRADASVDLAGRSRGAVLLASGQCALSGYSAAELLGAGCAPADANAELTVPGGDFREQPGLTIHRDLLADDEIVDVGGVPVTTALRTAWDLARWLPTVEAVVAMDALARVGRLAPQAAFRIQDRYPRARWRCRVPGVIDLADPRAESPMETRSRLVLVRRGLPRPELQYQVYDELGEFVARLDMAYPWLKLAIEYDGRGHLTAWQQQADARRLNRLDACGWSVLRFTSPDVLHTPEAMAAQVREALSHRSRRRSMS
ncbi:MAG: endonuclease domain-containing protein [Pseudonocardiaceae bacterium]